MLWVALTKRDDILQKLREREANLKARGVLHAALFGSLARGDERQESDYAGVVVDAGLDGR